MSNRQVTELPPRKAEWWERLRDAWGTRLAAWARRHPQVVRWLKLARNAGIVLGLVWVIVVVLAFPNIRTGMAAYVGSLWVAVCCFLVARTRTIKLTGVLRMFSIGIIWSLAIGVVSTILSDVALVSMNEQTDIFGTDIDVFDDPETGAGPMIAVASFTEEAFKLLPLAALVLLAPGRARRFATIDWLLIGVTFGCAFMAAEELVRRIFLTAPGASQGLLDFCAWESNPAAQVECYGLRNFSWWPFGAGAFDGEYASYDGHHVLTGLITVAVGLGIATWRATASRPTGAKIAARFAAIAAPALMFWIAVVDHAGRNAVAATFSGDDAWLDPETSNVPAVIRWSFVLSGRGEGREELLVLLFLVALIVDSVRYAGRDYAAAIPEERPSLTDRVIDRIRLWLRGPLSGIPAPLRGCVDAVVVGVVALPTMAWRDLVQMVQAYARQPGQGRLDAVRHGRAAVVMQREAREIVCEIDGVRGRSVIYRLAGLLATVALVVLGVVVAVSVASSIGGDVSSGILWLAGQLNALADWWDGLSLTEQIAVGVFAGALLALPFGFGWGFFLGGIGTWMAEHGHGLADLAQNPRRAIIDYLTQTPPSQMVLDAIESLLTFAPAGLGAGAGTGLRHSLRSYLDDPAEWRAAFRARMAQEGERGAIAFHGGIPLINGRLPRNSVWAGLKYEGPRWTPELAAKYPDGVRFTNQGFPDFSPYARERVNDLPLNGRNHHDFRLANEAAGFDRTPRGWTWHHVEDGKTLILVPTDLHQAVPHTGGAAILK